MHTQLGAFVAGITMGAIATVCLALIILGIGDGPRNESSHHH